MPALARFAAVCLCLTPVPLFAQPGEQPERRGGAPPAQAPRDLSPPITLDFPGGNLGQFVESLRKAAAASATDAAVNVVLTDPALSSVPVPRLSLRHVSLDSALQAAVYPRDRKGSRDVVVDVVRGFGGNPVMMPAAPVYVITAGPEPKQRAPRVEIFDIREVSRTGTRVEAVLTAVETALRMDEGGEGAEIKFHEDSGLLITRATPEQLDAVRQVISNLMHGSKAASREQAIAERRKQIEVLTRELDHSYQELGMLRSEAQKTHQVLRSVQEQAREQRDKPDAAAALQDKTTELHALGARLDIQIDRIQRETQSREQLLQQLKAAELGLDETAGEIARLRAENAELRNRISELEKRPR